MTTLIAVYNSDGCVGRCDAKCYAAVSGPCTCICRGANHGAGLTVAQDNTQRLAESWAGKWNAEHPDQRVEIGVQETLQLSDVGTGVSSGRNRAASLPDAPRLNRGTPPPRG